MKQVITILLLTMTSAVFATVHTVSNSPSTIAQFNTIQAAVNAAAVGDTIYVVDPQELCKPLRDWIRQKKRYIKTQRFSLIL
jgi:hypothetical protein